MQYKNNFEYTLSMKNTSYTIYIIEINDNALYMFCDILIPERTDISMMIGL